MELSVLDNKGKQSSTVKFDESVFKTKNSTALLHEAVVAIQANKRSGTHATKNRAQVSGGGIKPWRQKGTGRARAGSIRSPLWRKGGVIFGPNPRSYRQELPKKKRRLAFHLAVKSLMESDRLQVVEPIKLDEPKTKYVANVYKKWQAPSSSLFVVSDRQPDFIRASRNIPDVAVTDVGTLNTYDCLKARRVFITADALERLSARLSKAITRQK